MSPAWPLTIYYDASCPLCREEMHALADRDAGARLRLLDASAPGLSDAAVAAAGLDAPALMARIHARDADGRWYHGIDVFELAYRAADLDRVAALWAHPRLRPLWDAAYPWVARFRRPLSRLGLHRALGAWIRHSAARAQARRAAACQAGVCPADGRPAP